MSSIHYYTDLISRYTPTNRRRITPSLRKYDFSFTPISSFSPSRVRRSEGYGSWYNFPTRCTATRPTVPGVSEITDHLLLSAAAVLRPDILKRLGVKCVINATSELPDTPLPELGRNQTPVIYLRIPVYDRIESDLSSYFDLVADTIDQVRQNGGTTLVHCVAGISRSASLCLAYLMKYNGMSLRSAYRLVKSARPQIRPNAGFMRQLIAYEYRLHRTNSVQFVYNEVTKSHIPDLYEIDYEPMLHFQRKYKNVCLVGRH